MTDRQRLLNILNQLNRSLESDVGAISTAVYDILEYLIDKEDKCNAP